MLEAVFVVIIVIALFAYGMAQTTRLLACAQCSTHLFMTRGSRAWSIIEPSAWL
jgi:hypothetical protein